MVRRLEILLSTLAQKSQQGAKPGNIRVEGPCSAFLPTESRISAVDSGSWIVSSPVRLSPAPQFLCSPAPLFCQQNPEFPTWRRVAGSLPPLSPAPLLSCSPFPAGADRQQEHRLRQEAEGPTAGGLSPATGPCGYLADAGSCGYRYMDTSIQYLSPFVKVRIEPLGDFLGGFGTSEALPQTDELYYD